MDMQYNQRIYDVSMAKNSLSFGDLEVVHEVQPVPSISSRVKASFIRVFRAFIKSREESADRYIAMLKDDYKW